MAGRDGRTSYGGSGGISRSNHRKPILAASKYDGSTPLMDYKAFQACVEFNEWTREEQGLHLSGSLMGSAQEVLSSLPLEDRYDYDSLKDALERRFQQKNQTELYRSELENRRQNPKEKLTELGQAVKRMVVLAYPTAEQSLQDVLAKDAFLDALQDDMDMVWKIQQSRPSNLEEATHVAIELESFCVSNETKRPRQKYTRTLTEPKTDDGHTVEKLMKQIAGLTDGMKTLQLKLEKMGPDRKKPDGVRNMTQNNHSQSPVGKHFTSPNGLTFWPA
ncbi:hypothetical protein LOTGIDRAFT_171409 [Lottia gigantea]|uniref:Retrotransposon gag domain-containing protein n=1 Tax=Lottia gigantea TaxID=225164 RepID=V4BBP1_LOTGI|nr:hypothetical protein LOTGIDRAFT_171409 [Lottia gigantea]ESP03472.1 hypothetical protein LOTGIDRAFT_171409 [Lottia gigantea]